MREALAQAAENGEAPVGAIVVANGEIGAADATRPSGTSIPLATPRFWPYTLGNYRLGKHDALFDA